MENLGSINIFIDMKMDDEDGKYLRLFLKYNRYGGFHTWGYPKMIGCKGKCQSKLDDLRVPPFQETFI